MDGHKYAELILLKLRCPNPECGHEFPQAIADLVGQSYVACPTCGDAVSVQKHRRAIEHLIDIAAQLDLLVRKHD